MLGPIILPPPPTVDLDPTLLKRAHTILKSEPCLRGMNRMRLSEYMNKRRNTENHRSSVTHAEP